MKPCSFHAKIITRPGESPVPRQESADLNMAKFIRAQTLLLLERLEQIGLDEASGCCERL
ncbi:Rop family plasmid primer RNA-binding protein, partial [Enterobacter hormaechei]|uniref:Rop family plasmid primer RNA-binding protein n=1 Tax=Enterobacter hormaechei TaxID=158836 RepID=UPI002E2DBDF0